MSGKDVIYEATNKHERFYTGGQIQWTKDGTNLICQCDGLIKIFNVTQGIVTSTINKPEEGGIEDSIIAFSLSDDDTKLLTSHKSCLLKLWDWREGTVVKAWKSIHKGHAQSLSFNRAGNLVASGATDCAVRVWDLEKRTLVHVLHGSKGLINITQFHPYNDSLVFAASGDAVIRGWDTETGELQVTLDSHYSMITGFVFCDANHLVSCSRDKVIILWDVSKQEALKTLPAFESLEGMVLLPNEFYLPNRDDPYTGGPFVATAGEKGAIRVWDMRVGKEIYLQKNSLVSEAAVQGGLSITHLLFNWQNKSFGVVSTDQHIVFHNLETFNCEKQLIGFTDEILDLAFIGKGDTHLAVATNSPDIKLYDLAEMGCQLLKGHTDLVLALGTSKSNPNFLLSCGKDNSVRVWLMKADKMCAIASSIRHNGSVGSVAASQLSISFFLSVGEDTCLKLWPLPKDLETTFELQEKETEIAHAKDINCVSVAPNDKVAATGSQDKTVKLWCTETLSLLGVLQGHRKGVWSVRFSPVDRVLLSTSADCCLKLWSLDDLTCLQTLQGHEASVLRGEFRNSGSQIISCCADGLLKVWLIKTSECVATFDEHEGKIWALAVRHDGKYLVTGDSESTLVQWKDVSKERMEEKLKLEDERLLKEQELSNLLHTDNLTTALNLALSLERPFQVLKIIQGIMKKGDPILRDAIKQLDNEEKERLLNCAVAWNTNSKNSHPAQLVIFTLMEDLSTDKLKPTNFRNTLEGAIPYTERHFKRLTKFSQDLQFLNYTLACMQIHSNDVSEGKGNKIKIEET